MRPTNFYWVSLGAVPGAMLRWHINNNFIINMIGAFLIGFIYALPSNLRFKLIFALGFCGSLTSFSTWIVNSLELIISGFLIQAISLLITMVLVGIIFVYFGYYVGQKLYR